MEGPTYVIFKRKLVPLGCKIEPWIHFATTSSVSEIAHASVAISKLEPPHEILITEVVHPKHIQIGFFQ